MLWKVWMTTYSLFVCHLTKSTCPMPETAAMFLSGFPHSCKWACCPSQHPHLNISKMCYFLCLYLYLYLFLFLTLSQMRTHTIPSVKSCYRSCICTAVWLQSNKTTPESRLLVHGSSMSLLPGHIQQLHLLWPIIASVEDIFWTQELDKQ